MAPSDPRIVVLVGGSAPGLKDCLDSCADAGVKAVHLVAQGQSQEAYLSDAHGALDVRTHATVWEESFSDLRNFAVHEIARSWLLFIDSDEWLLTPFEELRSICQGLDPARAYSPSITEQSTGSIMTGVPRLLHSSSGLRFRKRVHEHCFEPDAHGGERDVGPSAVQVQLGHAGYDARTYDLDAKFARNYRLGRMDLAENPGDLRTIYFLVRDGLPFITFHEAADMLDELDRVCGLDGAGYTANGVAGAWYRAMSYPLVTEIALRDGDLDAARLLADRMSSDPAMNDDGLYYSHMLNFVEGVAHPSELTQLMRLRRDNATFQTTALATDGRQFDALIVAFLARFRGHDDAHRYRRACLPWTDGFFQDSWPRVLGEPPRP